MIIHNFEQRSEEWYKIRELKLTASNAQAIGNKDKGLETLCRKLVYEYLSKNKDNYTNEDIERGISLEEEAIIVYSLETNNEVEKVGFVETSKFVGCSPDGLIGDDGLIEIKCYSDKNYLDYIIDDKIESKYLWQVQMQMMLTFRKWCDFVVYNPNFEKNIIIKRVEPNIEMQEKIIEGIKVGEKRIQEILEICKTKSK